MSTDPLRFFISMPMQISMRNLKVINFPMLVHLQESWKINWHPDLYKSEYGHFLRIKGNRQKIGR